MNTQGNRTVGSTQAILKFTIACAFILSSCSLPTPHSSSCGDATMTYKYPGENSIGERYEGDHWWRINSQSAPKAASGEITPSTADPGEPTFPVFDCSSEEFVCARTYRHVFAVPRGEFKVGARYIAEGSDLSTEGCLRSVNGVCKTALFISDCRSVDGATRNRADIGAIVGKDCRVTGWGQQVMFIADRERGVIAYEQADWWKPGTDISRWDLSTLGTSAGLLALVETKGLLSCGITSAKRR